MWSAVPHFGQEFHSIMSPMGQKQKAESQSNAESRTGVFKSIASWVLRNPAVSLTIMTALVYVWIRQISIAFYQPFGLTIEDVGVQSTNLVARSTVTVFLLSFLVGLCSVFIVTLIAARGKSKPGDPWRWSRHVMSFLIIGAVFCTFALLITFSVSVTHWSRQVRAGEAIQEPFWFPIRAEPATVLSTDVQDALDLPKRQCLLFLGSTDRNIVLYDVRTQETVLLPTPTTVLSLHRWSFGGCTPGAPR
jgi:hypothetical protein